MNFLEIQRATAVIVEHLEDFIYEHPQNIVVQAHPFAQSKIIK